MDLMGLEQNNPTVYTFVFMSAFSVHHQRTQPALQCPCKACLVLEIQKNYDWVS